MNLLAHIPTPVVVAAIALIGGFIGWLGRGLSFVVRRWWTGSPKQEHAAYLNSVADLAAKLRANGMTIDDVRALEAVMRSPSIASSSAANQLVLRAADETEPAAFHSNAAMKARAGAAYEVAEAKLQQVVMDLRLLLREPEAAESLAKAQDAWKQYRNALEDRALREFSGGTHAPLAMALAGLAETERRAEELRAEVQDRSAH